MEGYKGAVLVLFLFIVPCFGHEVSVSCMMAYEEAGAPGVFRSFECPQWTRSTKISQNSTKKCQFATMQGHREHQEDRVTCNLDMKVPFLGRDGPEEATIGIAAVFDGHGGHEASELASKVLLDYLLVHVIFNAYNSQDTSTAMQHLSLHGILESALEKAIEDIDSEFSQNALVFGYDSGSTATVALMLNSEVLIANVGDSKAILCSQRSSFQQNAEGVSGNGLYAEELTIDHRPDRREERDRIEEYGGFVRVWGVPRVNGILAMSRAIGDVPLKRYGVIPEPEVTKWRSLTTKDSYLVVATDGIFETLNPQDVCDLLGEDTSKSSSSECDLTSSLAECIVHEAFKRGSTDNLSAIVLPLGSTDDSS